MTSILNAALFLSLQSQKVYTEDQRRTDNIQITGHTTEETNDHHPVDFNSPHEEFI